VLSLDEFGYCYLKFAGVTAEKIACLWEDEVIITTQTPPSTGLHQPFEIYSGSVHSNDPTIAVFPEYEC
jgi:hypothetical protein